MKKSKIVILSAIGAVLGISLTSYISSYSKYVSNSVWNYYLKSQSFYFESDLLSSEELTHSNTLWDGEKVNFTIQNNMSEDLVTESDVNYEVTCEVLGEGKDKYECSINGEEMYSGVLSGSKSCVNETEDGVDTSSFTKSECESKGYKYKIGTAKKDLYFEVTSTNDSELITDVSVKVKATSTVPYKKNLTAVFNLNKNIIKEGEITKLYNSYDDYSRLILTNTYEEDKCLILNFDSTTKIVDLAADEDNVSSYNSEYVNGVSIKIPAKSSVDYIFYDLVDTPVDDFEIHILEICE